MTSIASLLYSDQKISTNSEKVWLSADKSNKVKKIISRNNSSLITFFALKYSYYAMSKIFQKRNDDDSLKTLYEPLYGRSLSLKEILEIKENLQSFAQTIIKIAGQIRDKPRCSSAMRETILK